MPIRSLVTGIVTKKNIVEGDSLKMGMPAYEIADLSTVWLEADVFENDLAAVRLLSSNGASPDYLHASSCKPTDVTGEGGRHA